MRDRSLINCETQIPKHQSFDGFQISYFDSFQGQIALFFQKEIYYRGCMQLAIIREEKFLNLFKHGSVVTNNRIHYSSMFTVKPHDFAATSKI